MHVISISDAGPDESCLSTVLEALVNLGNKELTSLVQNLGPTKWDNNLQGGRAICGFNCMNNKPEPR